MTFVKDSLDSKVENATKEMYGIMKQMPTFFRETRTSTSSKEHEMLAKDATPQQWRQALLNTQLDIKALYEGFGDVRQAFMECMERMSILFSILKEGYDIQGRALISLSRKLDIDFDKLLELYIEQEKESKEEFPS